MSGVGETAEKLRRATVQVRAGRGSSGSGVIWTPAGLIVTNAHVMRREYAEVELWDGGRFPARLLSIERRQDLASLQIDAAMLPAVQYGDSGKLRVGELVIAAGNPLGFVGAVSTGVIHAVGPLAGFDRRPWVVSDVRLAPGNSGGPLANARGEVVGINTMVAGRLGLAIPVNTVKTFLAGHSRTSRLGVALRPVQLAPREMGLLVLEIEPQSAAARASLLPGDILLGASGRRFHSPDDLREAIDQQAGASLELQFRRGGNSATRSVVVQLEPALRAA